jgi:capsular exopolysaccharide synthesis family protein
MTERLMTARARRIELEGSYQQARSASPATLGSLPAVARDPGVLEAQRLFDVATGKLSELQARLGPAHDQVQQAQADLAAARTSLQRRQQLAAASLTKEYEAALATERALMQGLGEARGAAQGVNREEFQLAVLEREYQSNKQLYDMFMSRAKETSLIGDVQPSVGRVTEAAVPAEVPHKPNRRSIVTNAALVALLLGMLAAVAIDRLDNTVKGSEDAELRLRSPVLASLPQLEKTSRRDMAKLFLENKHSHFAEGIRTARTGIALSSLDEANKRLLVTSSIPGEGKTTVSVNLAFAHAHANQKTLLIDCDMRRAHTSRLLGLGSAKFGVSHLVAGTVTAAECIVPMGNTGLYVLPVGEAPPNPLEVLLSKRFKETLEALSKDYPMIVIDSPPVELVSDALVIAPLVSNVAVVVRAMSTPAPLVRKTQQRLARAGGRLLGVVINGLNFQEARQYYGEYAHSSYSYGYDAGGDTVLDDPSASTKKKRSRFIGSDGGKKPGDKTLEASGDDRKAA